MARPLRIEFAGVLYHVTARGEGREGIYVGDEDRHLFLDVLGRVCRRFNWWVQAYCLMGNHYHLLVETPDGNLSSGMRQLNGVYTQRFNQVHGRVGHVFQGRYKAIVVQKDAYLVELARYVVLNPVPARLVRQAGRWPRSTYRATVGAEVGPDWLETLSVLYVFGDTQFEAVERYIRFVADGKGQPSPWGDLKHQLFLGSEAFTEAMRRKVPRGRDFREVPQARPRPVAKPISDYAQEHADRDSAIAAAYASGGRTMREVGDYFGLHYSRVSKTVAKGETAKRKT
jgi:putative transposase